MRLYYIDRVFMHVFLSYVLWDWCDAVLCSKLVFWDWKLCSKFVFWDWNRRIIIIIIIITIIIIIIIIITTTTTTTTTTTIIITINEGGLRRGNFVLLGPFILVFFYAWITPSLPQPVKFPRWKMHGGACKQYIPVLWHIYLQCYAFWWKSFHMPLRKRR